MFQLKLLIGGGFEPGYYGVEGTTLPIVQEKILNTFILLRFRRMAFNAQTDARVLLAHLTHFSEAVQSLTLTIGTNLKHFILLFCPSSFLMAAKRKPKEFSRRE